MKLFLVILTGVLATSCASVGKSILLGTATGGVAGAISGVYWGVEDREKYAMQAALFTGLAGGITAYFVHKGLEKRDERTRQETLFNLDKFGLEGETQKLHSIHNPVLMAPKIESRWIETQAQGKKLIEGHRVWVITEDSQWPENQQLKKGD